MYNAFCAACERVLRIPPAPAPPPGDHASTRLFRAAPNFYKYLLVLWAAATGLFLVVLSSAMIGPVVGFVEMRRQGNRGAPFLLLVPIVVFGVFALIRLFRLAVLRLDYEKRWYLVTDRSLRIREGVVKVREMTVTFANIQNISVSQGPVQRLLGIANLQVDTAGGGGAADAKRGRQNLHTAWFRGIDNANEVRELIQQRLRQLKDSGLGDHEEAAAQPRSAEEADLLAPMWEIHVEARRLRQAVEQSAGNV